MTTVEANGVTLGVEHFGDAAAARPARGRHDHALLAGMGVGGMVAQVAALDHAAAFSALTLAGRRPALTVPTTTGYVTEPALVAR